jgi:hypothetical protein
MLDLTDIYRNKRKKFPKGVNAALRIWPSGFHGKLNGEYFDIFAAICDNIFHRQRLDGENLELEGISRCHFLNGAVCE